MAIKYKITTSILKNNSRNILFLRQEGELFSCLKKMRERARGQRKKKGGWIFQQYKKYLSDLVINMCPHSQLLHWRPFFCLMSIQSIFQLLTLLQFLSSPLLLKGFHFFSLVEHFISWYCEYDDEYTSMTMKKEAYFPHIESECEKAERINCDSMFDNNIAFVKKKLSSFPACICCS